MIIPGWKRIRSEDFSEEFKELGEKLAFPINSIMDSILEALNKRLTFTDNISSTIATFTTSVTADGSPKNTIFIKQDDAVNTLKVQGIYVINAVDANNNPPDFAPFLSWVQNKTGINISNIKGLRPNVSYSIKIVILN